MEKFKQSSDSGSDMGLCFRCEDGIPWLGLLCPVCGFDLDRAYAPEEKHANPAKPVNKHRNKGKSKPAEPTKKSRKKAKTKKGPGTIDALFPPPWERKRFDAARSLPKSPGRHIGRAPAYSTSPGHTHAESNRKWGGDRSEMARGVSTAPKSKPRKGKR